MVELQIINRILADKNDSIIELNNITPDYFTDYPEEFEYIQEHKREYGNIPDVETFLAEFEDFEIIKVNESNEYLVKTFREEYLYKTAVPILVKMSDKLKVNSYDAVEYLKSNIDKLKIDGVTIGTDIISQANERLEVYKETRDNTESHFIPTGFKELDDVLGGFHKGEELVVIFARTGQGKTWVSVKMLEHMWKMNQRIGILEPEMSAIRTGYRFDTLHKHISN